MRIPTQRPVVVGVDGSPASLAAVRLAAREALSRGRTLHVAHAFTWPDPRPGAGGTDYAPARRAASRVVAEAVATAQRSIPGVDARGQLVDGPPGRVLRQLSRGAVLLVLGGDALAASGRLPAGSPLLEVVSQAWCPVAVARGTRPPAGPVLAALDGSAYSILALRFAAEEAERRGGPVHVAHVVMDDGPDAEAAAGRLVDEALAAVPGLTAVRRRLLIGVPAETLVQASRDAGLIVLGPRGLRAGGRLGTVAEEVLRRGTVPAVFVHGPRIPTRRVPAPPGRPARTLRT
ncbi:universal stress protein [Actinoplanes aureus]|uniref:Universal stress protein n=1 Tax=Actinoplanes aureus TaxID=2792083 RepID=A0A931CHR7_9ACTN|nr:universal stress protein [Actinoplanes aureus]MBG0567503.1 universal stress protein [Actinoplanes aureus]